ncbi:MAG: GNAT family N-acetyltransferase, partial [Candidatus Kariarchaeaceae archaeon]
NISDKPTQEDDFKTTALAGFEAKPDSPMYPIFSALFDVCLRLEGLNSVYYLDGKPVGTGSAYPSDDFLMLYNGSTLEEARGMKIQQAMLHHRLAYGKRKGLKHAVVQTAADSTSGRNCQRVGFQLAFPMHFYRKSLK